jgi:hypothetical protein
MLQIIILEVNRENSFSHLASRDASSIFVVGHFVCFSYLF